MADPATAGRRLVLVRHGQTSWNAEGRAQGLADVPLDETGRIQAEAMARAVAAYEPVLLVTSDLVRARETAAFLERAAGLDAEEDPRFREYDVGALTGLTRAEFIERGGHTTADGHAHVGVEGSESVEAVAARIVPATREVYDRLSPGQTGVIVQHGAALRIAVAGLLGWPLEAHDGLAAMANCGWALLQDSPGGRVRLTAYNRTAGG